MYDLGNICTKHTEFANGLDLYGGNYYLYVRTKHTEFANGLDLRKNGKGYTERTKHTKHTIHI